MSGEGINYPYITQYLESLLGRREGILKDISLYTESEYVPIVDSVTASFLEVLCRLKQPKTILEIGTAVGFSAILMQNAAGGDCYVTTIERYAKAAAIARQNFDKAGMENKITLLEGEAKEILPTLESAAYDMIFLDGAKGQYPIFLPALLNLLKTEGLLVCDNVLYKGMTAEDSLKIRRKRTIVSRLRKFLTMIAEDESLKSSILPIGDGVCVSIKLYDKEDKTNEKA